MRGRAAGLALLVASFALAAPTPTPAVKAKVSATALQSRSAARIRAKGLDPAHPNIKTLLESLAAADKQVARPAATLRTLPAVAAHKLTVPSSATALSADNTQSKSKARRKAPQIMDLVGGNPQRQTDSLGEGGLQGAWVVGTFSEGTASIDVNLGPCGSFRFDSVLFGPEALGLGIHKGAPVIAALLAPAPDALPNGIRGELRLMINGAASNPLPIVTGDVWRATHAANVTITSGVPHFSGDGGTGLTAAQVITPGGPRISTVPDFEGGTGASGIDELGAGVYLLNGYTATAKIVRAHSYMDAPSYIVPSDSSRGATIQQQPQKGRLATRVAWSYAAGESIDYEIEWTLMGSPMKRPLSSMPKPACGE